MSTARYKSRVSEILSGKRSIGKAQAKHLAEFVPRARRSISIISSVAGANTGRFVRRIENTGDVWYGETMRPKEIEFELACRARRLAELAIVAIQRKM
jgi:hypothetical protein